jgi:hypothetical protein
MTLGESFPEYARDLALEEGLFPVSRFPGWPFPSVLGVFPECF